MSVNIMLKSVPNMMTVLRLAAAPLVAVLIWADDAERGYLPALIQPSKKSDTLARMNRIRAVTMVVPLVRTVRLNVWLIDRLTQAAEA